MKKNLFQRLSFFVLILTICFAFSNCRMLQKTKTVTDESEISKIDHSEEIESTSKIETEFSQENQSSYQSSFAKFSELFNLNYEPLFDANGNYIPLIFKHTVNGITEEIYLSGGSLEKTNNKTSEAINIAQAYRTNITYKTITNYRTITNYQTETTYKSRYETKDKKILSFDISFLLLAVIVILLIYEYFPKGKSKLTAFVNRIFNGKT